MSLEHYILIREALIELADDFNSLASTSDFFNHELLYAPEGVGEELDVWDDEDFELLQRSLGETFPWQEFRFSDDERQCSRYWSTDDKSGCIPLFEQLCERGWQLLLAASWEDSEDMPPRFCVYQIAPLDNLSSLDEWLALLHETAFRFPTAKLHGECESRLLGDRQCVSNVIGFDIIRASARLIDFILIEDHIVRLGSWDGPLELQLPPYIQSEEVEHGLIQPPNAPREVESVPDHLQGVIVDEGSFEVGIGQQRCFLGNTLAFRLFRRLANCPGIFVSIRTLQVDVWNDDLMEDNSIKRSVRMLRTKLQKAGVTEVKIDSSTIDHVRLLLD